MINFNVLNTFIGVMCIFLIGWILGILSERDEGQKTTLEDYY